MQTLNELRERSEVLEYTCSVFPIDEKSHGNALNELWRQRAGSASRNRSRITYLDLFGTRGYALANMSHSDKIAIMYDVVKFIVSDKTSYEEEWSGLLFVQSVIGRTLFKKCNSGQRAAIKKVVKYLINWKVKDCGCEIFIRDFDCVVSLADEMIQRAY